MDKKKVDVKKAPKKEEKKTVPEKAKVAPAKKTKWAPLSGGFMVVSILGLIVSAYLVKKYPSWAFAFLVIFAAMFIASLVAMRHAPLKGLK